MVGNGGGAGRLMVVGKRHQAPELVKKAQLFWKAYSSRTNVLSKRAVESQSAEPRKRWGRFA